MEDFELMFSMSSDDSDEFEDELLILLLKRRLRRRKRRTIWISKIRKLRTTYGVFHVLLPQMTDVEYKQYLRVSRDNFEIIHDFIKHDVQKQHTKFREPISIQERLAICLRFLALGETYRDLAFHFRVGESTVSIIIKEVCDSIWDKMQSKFLLEPNEDFWKKKADKFYSRWHFKNCLSAINGKHVILRKPIRSGSDYFNYKKAFSIVLLAGVDAYYKFTFIDVGVKGRFSDGYVFHNSNFGKKLQSNQLKLPPPSPLFHTGPNAPYVFVADATFPLSVNLMRPYPGTNTKKNMQNRIFNYWLSHGRQTVECAFGILSTRFRIYKRALKLKPSVVEKLIRTTCILHNFLRRDLDNYE